MNDKLNEEKYKVVKELMTAGADASFIDAASRCTNERDLMNVVYAWQRSSQYQEQAGNYAIDKSPMSVTVPRGYTPAPNDEGKIRETFGGMPRESVRPAVAIYNSANGTDLDYGHVDSILGRPMGYNGAKVDEFYKMIQDSRRVQDSVQDVLDYEKSAIGQAMKPAAQLVDLGSSFVPGAAGIVASAIGPTMRAYDNYRRGKGFDPLNYMQDVGYNMVGQSVGGQILKNGAIFARNIPVLNRAYPTMVRATQVNKEARAAFGDPMMAVQKRIEQLRAMKAGKTPNEQRRINQELVQIAEQMRQVGTKQAEPLYNAAMEESKNFVSGIGEQFIRPFTTGEKLLALGDDAATKFGVKSLSGVPGLFEGDEDNSQKVIDEAANKEKAARDSMLVYFLKLDSLRRLGYMNEEAYDKVSRMLGIDAMSEQARANFARETLERDSVNVAQ